MVLSIVNKILVAELGRLVIVQFLPSNATIRFSNFNLLHTLYHHCFLRHSVTRNKPVYQLFSVCNMFSFLFDRLYNSLTSDEGVFSNLTTCCSCCFYSRFKLISFVCAIKSVTLNTTVFI